MNITTARKPSSSATVPWPIATKSRATSAPVGKTKMSLSREIDCKRILSHRVPIVDDVKV